MKHDSYIKEISRLIVETFNKSRKLLIVGNGGSAAQAQHLAAELVGRYKHDRRALPALALTTDTSILTSVANDSSFDSVFSRQIEALGVKGDILLILSTSGASENCKQASVQASMQGIKVLELKREGEDTATIQENHLKMIHKICELVEEAYI